MPTGSSRCAIKAPRIFDGSVFLKDHCVVICGEHIDSIIPAADWQDDDSALLLQSGTLAPGFIDLQVNGGGDILFNAQPVRKALEIIARAHRGKGTTGFLPTVVSDTPDVHRRAVNAVRQARQAGHPGILGIHLEGPFFAPEKRGAHDARKLRRLSEEDVDWLTALADFPVLLTLAPEQVQPEQWQRLADSQLTLCAGHTGASYEQIVAAAQSGLSGVTHLFNAMTPLESRAPGAVGAALECDELWAGVIADGHHVHAAALRLAHRVKPAGKLILVSDAMATVGGELGSFRMYGETITEVAGKLVNSEGNFAGSAIGMIDAVAHAQREAAIPLLDCLQMASLHPAAILGLQNSLGRLIPGYRADIVHFSDAFAVENTWVAGAHTAHQGAAW